MVIINTAFPEEKYVNPVVTLGNFDGVHLGHQKIIRRVIEKARELGGISVVYTFYPHPMKVLYPDKPLPLITTEEQKIAIIEKLGVDVIICAPFDHAFSEIRAVEFVDDILVGGVGAKAIYVGFNYAFGKNREGNTDYLEKVGPRKGFRVEVVDPVILDDEPVSSSRIRRSIKEGRVDLAARMLDRPFKIEGEVIQGHRRGKQLGYPTANMILNGDLLPAPGVYAVRVRLPGVEKSLGGMANLGTNPTFGDEGMAFETHIFDFQSDIYGKKMQVDFLARLRDEVRFPSVNALIGQLKQDEADSRELLRKSEEGVG